MDKAKINRGFQRLQRERGEWDDILAAVEEIDRIGGLEIAATQAETGYSQAISRKQQADDGAKEALERLSNIQKRIDDAKGEAHSILREAQVKAGETINIAKADAAQRVSDADASIAAMDERARAAKAAMIAAEAKLAEVNDRIGKAKDQARALAATLGGPKT